MADGCEQLVLDLFGEQLAGRLADRLADRRQRPAGDGAARLLVALAKQGLDPDAVRPAALLALELDDDARRPE